MDHDANDGSDEEHRADRDFPMPALSSIQTGGRQQLQPMAIRSSSGGTTTLMLRSLLTGANVPVVASGAVAPGVVSQTTPVTLEPVTATESTGPPEDNRAGKTHELDYVGFLYAASLMTSKVNLLVPYCTVLLVPVL